MADTDPRSDDTLAKARHETAAIAARARGDFEAERRALDALALIERKARDAALVQRGRDEVAAAVEALADEIDGHPYRPECTDGGHACRECVTADAIRAAVAAAGASDLAAIRAEAWDEGEAAGRDNADDGYPDPMVENPYRVAAEAEAMG